MKKRPRKKPAVCARRLHKKIYIELYKVRLHLLVAPSLRDAQIAAKEFLGSSSDYEFGAKCMWRDYSFALLFRRDYMEHGVIAHEIFHVTNFIMKHVGGRFSDKSSEAYCYLAEWITTWVYRQLKKAKIKVSI